MAVASLVTGDSFPHQCISTSSLAGCQLILEPRLVRIVTASRARHTGGTRVAPQMVGVEVALYKAIPTRISRVTIIAIIDEGW